MPRVALYGTTHLVVVLVQVLLEELVFIKDARGSKEYANKNSLLKLSIQLDLVAQFKNLV